MDLLGHGKSDGMSGDMDFDDCLSSINEVIEKIKGTTRIFILAHSIGCTFALWYAHNFKGFVDGLILMAQYIRVTGVRNRSDAEPGIFYFLYFIARRLLTPKYLVKMTEVLPQLNKIGGEELGFIAFRNSKVKSLTDIGGIPVLFLHGKRDLIFYPVISEKFFKSLKNKQKEIIFFDCDHWFYDAVSYVWLAKYSEESRTQVIVAIKEWINRTKI